jgi:hypothetical protein
MSKNWKSLWLGFAIGIAWPVIVLILFYFIKFSSYKFTEFLNTIGDLELFGKFISICAYPNLLLFFIFIWRNLLYSARGVLMATIILAIFVFILNYTA